MKERIIFEGPYKEQMFYMGALSALESVREAFFNQYPIGVKLPIEIVTGNLDVAILTIKSQHEYARQGNA